MSLDDSIEQAKSYLEQLVKQKEAQELKEKELETKGPVLDLSILDEDIGEELGNILKEGKYNFPTPEMYMLLQLVRDTKVILENTKKRTRRSKSNEESKET
jgi:hypothetical protein